MTRETLLLTSDLWDWFSPDELPVRPAAATEPELQPAGPVTVLQPLPAAAGRPQPAAVPAALPAAAPGRTHRLHSNDMETTTSEQKLRIR